MRQQRSREFWAGLVREIAGGASVSEVARRHSVALSTLHSWKKRLGSVAKRETPALVPIVLKPGRVGPAHECELEWGGARVRFAAGTDVTYVVALVRALGMQC